MAIKEKNPKACVALRPGVCHLCKEAIVPGDVLGKGGRWRIHLRCCCDYQDRTPAAGPMAHEVQRSSRFAARTPTDPVDVSWWHHAEVEKTDNLQAIRLGVRLSDYDGSSMSRAFEMQQRDPS